jgi:hypothetical protein
MVVVYYLACRDWFLILYGKSIANAPQAGYSNFLVLECHLVWFYLIIVKKLMNRYNAFTFVKWIYLFDSNGSPLDGEFSQVLE